jgi:hypothetical protein
LKDRLPSVSLIHNPWGMEMLVSSLQSLNASSFISISHSGMMAIPSFMSYPYSLYLVIV